MRAQRVAFDEVVGRAGQRGAEEEERVPELDERAVVQRGTFDALAVEDSPVLRPSILEHPLPEHALQPRMRARHTAIGYPEPERSIVAGDLAPIGAADGHRIGLREGDAPRPLERRVAAEHDEEAGCLAGARRTVLRGLRDGPRV